ncbi:MAG TPA: right-handed parallel beta-helix repeat-containing protein [Candidatus Nitrosotenuis sp.]|nr:right-handed parallel beta-helix repeat-containing protein [Candidatus Nitrosotenuis sp.]
MRRFFLLALALAAGLAAGCAGHEDFVLPQPAPQAADYAFTALGNSPLQVTAARGLLSQGITAPIVGFSAVSARGGSVEVASDGSFRYLPPTGLEGSDSFTYTLANSRGSSTGTVRLTVGPLCWYVDNSRPVSGDGSLAAPFVTLAQAQAASGPDDILFVFAGDGSSTGMDSGLTLQAGQDLVGEGAGLTFNNGAEEQVLVEPGPSPHLVNGSGAVVVLADGNAVTGCHLSASAGGPAVAGQSVQGLEVRDNLFDGADSPFISLQETSGALAVTGNTFQGPDNGNALELVATAPLQASLEVSANTFEAPPGSAPCCAVLVQMEGGAQASLNASGNLVRSADATAAYEDGFAVVSDSGGGVQLSLSDNTLEAAALHGIILDPDGALTGTVSQNTIRDTLFGVLIANQSGGSAALTLSGNTLENATLSAVSLQACGTLAATVSLTGNTVTGSQGVGADASACDTTLVSYSFTGNSASGCDQEGLFLSSQGQGQLRARVQANRLTGNNTGGGAASLTALSADTSSTCLALLDNITDDYQLQQADASVFVAQESGNTGTRTTQGTITPGTCP